MKGVENNHHILNHQNIVNTMHDDTKQVFYKN